MHAGPDGIEIIKRNEGCELTAYQDIVDVWTIGYGDTGPDVYKGLTITQAEAERRLTDRLATEFEPGVTKGITPGAETAQCQFDAMVSLAYNIGVGGFQGSTVAREHKAGNYEAAADAFAMWNMAGGEVVPGLVRRREEEAELYRGHTATGAQPAPVMTRAQAERHLQSLQAVLVRAGVYDGQVDGLFGPGSTAGLNALLAAAGQPQLIRPA